MNVYGLWVDIQGPHKHCEMVRRHGIVTLRSGDEVVYKIALEHISPLRQTFCGGDAMFLRPPPYVLPISIADTDCAGSIELESGCKFPDGGAVKATLVAAVSGGLRRDLCWHTWRDGSSQAEKNPCCADGQK